MKNKQMITKIDQLKNMFTSEGIKQQFRLTLTIKQDTIVTTRFQDMTSLKNFDQSNELTNPRGISSRVLEVNSHRLHTGSSKPVYYYCILFQE
jgi:hypothetical protein